MEHEDVDRPAVAHRLDRRRTGVAGGRADDRRMLAALAERVIEHQAQELQRHVLEGQGRAVEQLEQVKSAVTQRLQRRHLGGIEGGIGLGDQPAEGHLVERAADEGLHDAEGDLAIGLAFHRGDLGLRELRPLGGQVESAVAGQARQHDLLERQRCGAALRALAGADVTHHEEMAVTPPGGRQDDPCARAWSRPDTWPASARDGSAA